MRQDRSTSVRAAIDTPPMNAFVQQGVAGSSLIVIKMRQWKSQGGSQDLSGEYDAYIFSVEDSSERLNGPEIG